MKNLLNLLERFSKSLNKDTLTKEIVSKVILERTRANIHPENISIKNGVLELNTSAVAKNEISLKEELIKEELKGAYNVSVTRVLYK